MTDKKSNYHLQVEDWPSVIDDEWIGYLIQTFAQLVNITATRIFNRIPSFVSLDDLISCGYIGLLEAAKEFNPGRNNEFKTFAEFRIKGAMLDFLRELDWIPRSVRAKAKKFKRTLAEREQEKGGRLEPEEIAATMEMSIEQYHKHVLNLNHSQGQNLHEEWDIISNIPDNSFNPCNEIESANARDMVEPCLSQLPFREQLILSLYYGEDMTMKEIADLSNCTESRVSQIHNKSLSNLHKLLQAGNENGDFPAEIAMNRLESPKNRRSKNDLPKFLSWWFPAKITPIVRKKGRPRKKRRFDFYIPDFRLVGKPFESEITYADEVYMKEAHEISKETPEVEKSVSHLNKRGLSRVEKLLSSPVLGLIDGFSLIKFHEFVAMFDQKEVNVLYFYYVMNLTLREVGDKLQLSMANVSKIKNHCLDRLIQYLTVQ